MGGGVQPIRSFTSCSTATPIRLAINRHDPHLAPARSRWATLPILVVVPALAARMSVSVVSRALCAQEYPASRRLSFLKAGIAQLLNRIPNVTHRERAGQPHSWQSDAADGDDRVALTARDRGRAAPPGRRDDAAGKKHIGRPRVTGPAELAALRQLISDGTSVTQAARTLKISRSAAYAALSGPGPKL